MKNLPGRVPSRPGEQSGIGYLLHGMDLNRFEAFQQQGRI